MPSSWRRSTRESSSLNEVIEPSLVNKSFDHVSEEATILGVVTMVMVIEIVPHGITTPRIVASYET